MYIELQKRWEWAKEEGGHGKLGLLFLLIGLQTFSLKLGTEGEIKIKIKYITSTLHFIKMICNIL